MYTFYAVEVNPELRLCDYYVIILSCKSISIAPEIHISAEREYVALPEIHGPCSRKLKSGISLIEMSLEILLVQSSETQSAPVVRTVKIVGRSYKQSMLILTAVFRVVTGGDSAIVFYVSRKTFPQVELARELQIRTFHSGAIKIEIHEIIDVSKLVGAELLESDCHILTVRLALRVNAAS